MSGARTSARMAALEWLIPLAITAFVVGPLAHMALHRPDHHHTPDGAVVFAEHVHPAGHAHPHPADGAHGHDPAPGHDGEPPHPTHHADGGAAHLGLAPPPPPPIVLPRRSPRGPPLAPAASLPTYHPLCGHRIAATARARAPPG